MEKIANCRIRTQKAYGSIFDVNARWPQKNITDVTNEALNNTRVDDPFSTLILSAPTDDISNLDTSKLEKNDNIEVFNQEFIISCKNMITLAENSLKAHPNLKKVVILEHAPRFDPHFLDPHGLKSELAKFANATMKHLCFTSSLRNKVHIGTHAINNLARNITEVFQTNKFVTPEPNKTDKHDDCPQAQYQKRQAMKNRHQFPSNVYPIPVMNKFEVLGNLTNM